MRRNRPLLFRMAFLSFSLFLVMGTIISSHSAEGAVSVTGDFIRTHPLPPGGTVTGTIVLENGGDAAQNVRVYTTNFLYGTDGVAHFEDATPTPRSNMAWITLDRDQVDLPPGGRGTVTYTVTAPNNPGLKGSYWSMIMIEPISPEELIPREKSDKTLNMTIKTITRQAVQIITEIEGEGLAAMRFGELKLTEEENGLGLNLELVGEGEKILRTNLWVEIYNDDQGLVGKFACDPFGLHPGCSRLEEIPIAPLPRGRYTALIVADCGGDDVFGVQTELVIQ